MWCRTGSYGQRASRCQSCGLVWPRIERTPFPATLLNSNLCSFLSSTRAYASTSECVSLHFQPLSTLTFLCVRPIPVRDLHRSSRTSTALTLQAHTTATRTCSSSASMCTSTKQPEADTSRAPSSSTSSQAQWSVIATRARHPPSVSSCLCITSVPNCLCKLVTHTNFMHTCAYYRVHWAGTMQCYP